MADAASSWTPPKVLVDGTSAVRVESGMDWGAQHPAAAPAEDVVPELRPTPLRPAPLQSTMSVGSLLGGSSVRFFAKLKRSQKMRKLQAKKRQMPAKWSTMKLLTAAVDSTDERLMDVRAKRLSTHAGDLTEEQLADMRQKRLSIKTGRRVSLSLIHI